jgi:hypothetical protein
MSKGLQLILFAAWITAAAVPAFSAEAPVGGQAQFGVKVDSINFTEDEWDDNDLDSGVLFGLLGYGRVTGNFYLGGEIGYAKIDGDSDTELKFLPVEFNAKFAVPLGRHVLVDVGGGLSYSWVEAKVLAGTVGDNNKDDGLWGGQIFGDVDLFFGRFFLGADFKYQFTEKFSDEVKLDNYRLGGHFGIIF